MTIYYYTFALSHVTKQDYTCHKKWPIFYALSFSSHQSYSISTRFRRNETCKLILWWDFFLHKLQNHSYIHVEQHKAYFMAGVVAKYKYKMWKLKCLKECTTYPNECALCCPQNLSPKFPEFLFVEMSLNLIKVTQTDSLVCCVIDDVSMPQARYQSWRYPACYAPLKSSATLRRITVCVWVCTN